MKKILLFMAFVAISITTFAQRDTQASMRTKKHKNRVEHIAQLLRDAGFQLSDKQYEALQNVYATEMAKMQAIRNQEGMTSDIVREKRQAVRQDTKDKVRSILSDEQIQTLEDAHAARKGSRLEGDGAVKPTRKVREKHRKAYQRISMTLEEAGHPLTQEQEGQIKELMAQQRAAIKAAKAEGYTDQGNDMIKEIRKDYRKQIAEVLTKPQRKALKAIKRNEKS